ncbi:sugar phosphate isomerase/epimerase [Micrococcales bacterium 31B]|nr:sugar phosphate isomerase/epimerase [Micrococcales bacterium 31B]
MHTPYHHRLGCSTISFRHLDLDTALATLTGLGFTEIDLGALPGICDHVPFDLTDADIDAVAAAVRAAGVTVRSVNGDIGDLNEIPDAAGQRARAAHLDRLLRLTREVGARALVLPCGALSHAPRAGLDDDLATVASALTTAAEAARAYDLEIWTESLHFYRLCHDLDRATRLAERLRGTPVGHVLDLSHVVASGGDPAEAVTALSRAAGGMGAIAHVHLRDAVPGNINLSIGNGSVDFAGGLAALRDGGFDGHFTLELEAHDLEHAERPAAAARAGAFISPLI